jgi:hypothetical protein
MTEPSGFVIEVSDTMVVDDDALLPPPPPPPPAPLAAGAADGDVLADEEPDEDAPPGDAAGVEDEVPEDVEAAFGFAVCWGRLVTAVEVTLLMDVIIIPLLSPMI